MTQWIAAWGVLGVALLCSQAIWRLTPLAVEPWVAGQMVAWQKAVFVGWIGVNLYAEGYRGFQRAFAPRVVARAFHLAHAPRPAYVALAPAYAMALFHASRKRLVVSWTVLLSIITVVMAVRTMPQPYRGMIDGGVVAGLAYGVIALLAIYVRALRGSLPNVDPGLPS